LGIIKFLLLDSYFLHNCL